MADYTIDLCEGGVATSSSNNGGGRVAAAAFDNSFIYPNFWNTQEPAVYPEWIRYDFAVPKKIRKIVMHPEGYRQYMPKDFLIQGSNNGTDWTTLNTQSNIAWVEFTNRSFEFTNDASYQSYRIYITAGNSSLAVSIYEIEMMEEIPISTYVRPSNIKGLYDISLKAGIRDAAKNGFVRPTLSEMFMSHKDFVEVPSAIPATFDTTRKATDIVLSNGNLTATNNASYDYGWVSVSVAPTLETNSKTYVEFEIIARYADNIMLGLIFAEEVFNYNLNTSYLIGGSSLNKSVVLSANGYNYFPNSGVVSGQYGVGDIIGITFDMVAKKVTFYNNNIFKYEATITGYTISDCRYAAFLARYAGQHASVKFIKSSEHNYTAPDGYKAFG